MKRVSKSDFVSLSGTVRRAVEGRLHIANHISTPLNVTYRAVAEFDTLFNVQ